MMPSATSMLTYPFIQFPWATGFIIIGVLSLVYLLYQWALPKPLPGIPYNESATKSIFGDAVEIKELARTGGSTRAWFMATSEKHKSPLVQIFLSPLSKPSLILSDYREAQDMLLRRGKEFDRSQRNCDIFNGIIPWHHIGMRTPDPQFKANRELVKDLMTPNFLNTVSGPEIYKSTSKWIEMWRFKAQAAKGRPFRAEEDIHNMSFDIIVAAAFGEDAIGALNDRYMEELRRNQFDGQLITGASSDDDVFVFPVNSPSEDQVAHQLQQDAVGISFTHPSPTLYHKFNNRTKPMRWAFAVRDAMLQKQIALGVRRVRSGEKVTSALDYMMQREIKKAKKEDREPVLDTPSMRDELYGYLGAGHDTSSTSLQWAVKHLAKEQDVQQKLRAALRAAYSAAVAESRQPSVAEIIAAQVPYLDAVIEEVLRLSGPVSTLTRETTVDTTLLGHRIPKGTHIFINIKGPNMTTPGFVVDEKVRSESSRAHNHVRGAWESPEMFLPERWLRKDEDGSQVYNAQAGPFLSFGTGVRGCFGRRLAYLEMRIVMTLLVWNFELGTLPGHLNTWETIDSLTIKPARCFVCLSEVRA